MENNFEIFTKIKVDLDDFKKAMKTISKVTGKALDGIEDDFSDLEKELLKDLKNYEKKVKKTTKKVGDEFEDLADDIEDEFEDIVDTAEDSLKDIEKQTKKSTDKVSKEFKDLGKDATKNFGEIEDEFEDATDDMGKTADNVTKMVVRTFDSMSDKAGSNFSNINSDFKSSVGKLSDISKDVSNAIQNNFKTVDDGLKGNFNSIGSQFGSSIGSMVGESSSIVDRIQSTFDGLTSGLRSKFSQISATFKSATGDMPSYASNLSAGVDNKIRQIGANAKKIFSKVEDDYKLGSDEIVPTTKKITTKTTQELSKIPDKLAREFSSMSDTFEKVFNEMEEESGETTLGIVHDFNEAKRKVERNAKRMENIIKSAFGDSEVSVRVWGKTITATSGKATSKMQILFDKAVTKMDIAIKGFANGMKRIISKGATGAINAIKGLPSGTKSAMSKVKQHIDKVADSLGAKFKENSNKAESALDGLKGTLGTLAGAVAGAFGVSAISGMIDEARELNKELGKVLFSMSQMGMSSGASKEAYASVFSVIGDEGRAGETIQNLASVAKSEEDLLKMTELVTDAHLTLGERVTPEALAESIALSAQKGEIDGVLADVVEQCGISEEKFAEKLEGTKNQTEALNLITETLSGTFAGATEEYKKANPEITKLNESMAENQIATMQLGEALAPLKTAFLDALTPIYQWLAEKLPAAFTTIEGVFTTVKENLSAIDWSGVWEWVKEIGGYIADTFKPLWDDVVDLFQKGKEKLDEIGNSETAQKTMDAITGAFKWLSENGELVEGIIVGIATAFGTYAAIMGVLNTVGAIYAGVQFLINAAMAASPITWICLGIGLVVGAFVVLWKKCEGFRKFWKGLWKAFKGAIKEFKPAIQDVKTAIGKAWDWICDKSSDLKNWVVDAIEKLKDGAISAMKTLANKGFINPFNAIVKGIRKGINKIVDCINGITDFLGLGKVVDIHFDEEANVITPLAKGTNHWKGGTALVGEAGAELVSDPRLGTFVADQPMILPLSQGAAVLRNSKTKKLFNSMGIPMYKDGKDEGFFSKIWNFITKPFDLLKEAFLDISFDDIGFLGNVTGFVGAIKDKIIGGISDWFGKKTESATSYTSGDVSSYTNMVKQAAGFFGDTLTQNELQRVLQQIRTESGGNPRIMQTVDDVNMRNGNPAQGLLQYVPSTFKGYAVAGYGDILNPYHQLLAFFNNSTWRKALPKLGEIRGWTPRGAKRMADGGLVKGGHGGIFANIGEASHDELVIPLNQQGVTPLASALIDKLEQSGDISGGDITVNVPVYLDGQVIAEKTIHITDTLNKRKSRKNGKR